jgi:catechol 2,3-dioxygenase-like lactoylglutathione lyase family enzyme
MVARQRAYSPTSHLGCVPSAGPSEGRPFRALLEIEVMTMLADALAVTTVAVTDVDRARRFYQDQVGLTLIDETPSGCLFGAGRGSRLSVRRGQPNVGQTVAHFEVGDLEAVVRDLTSRGITFEEYETLKTVNGIAQIGPARGAWFKDPDGNVLGLREGPRPAGF